VEEAEVSTAAAVAVADSMVVAPMAVATMVARMATAAVGEWVRCTAAEAGTEEWAAVRRRAGLEVDGVGPLVEVLAADCPAIEGM
jgi:hypothetical protein